MNNRKSEVICIEQLCGLPVLHTKSAYWCEYHFNQWRYHKTGKKPYDPIPPVSTLRKFNITRATYQSLLDRQGGCCAICLSPPKKNRLAIDHDHSCCPGGGSCGKCIRGLLCAGCNVQLGAVERGFYALAFEYLERYKVERSGKSVTEHANARIGE